MTDARNSRPLAGILWMVASGLAFVALTALVKSLGTSLPASQSAFLRYALGLVLFLPFVAHLRRHVPNRRQMRFFLLRGVFHTLGVALWFYAMARIPLADVTAMNYLTPVLITVVAAIFLGEALSVRRITAVVIALIGALIILRPGFREVGPGHIAMLGTATLFAASYAIGKFVTDGNDPLVVVTMLSVTVTIGLLPMAIATWQPPTPHQYLVLFLVSIFATLGHFLMTLAFKAAPLTVTQPVTFLQLVWAVLAGYLLFGEDVDPFVLLGGLVILGAVSFITFREEMLKRRAAAAVGEAES